jgi:dephospho-CoA kinase
LFNEDQFFKLSIAIERMNPSLETTYKLALTGGIGSGKSAAGIAFEKFGIPVIDSDAIAYQITAPHGAAIDAIKSIFGSEYLTPEGALDRTKMRSLVFNDPQALKKLESITHPLIRELSEKTALESLENNPPYIIFMIPLLFESHGWQGRFNKIVVVDCSVDLQIKRVALRNQLHHEMIEKIIATQTPRAMRLQYADYVIENNGTLNELEEKVSNTHLQILKNIGV